MGIRDDALPSLRVKGNFSGYSTSLQILPLPHNFSQTASLRVLYSPDNAFSSNVANILTACNNQAKMAITSNPDNTPRAISFAAEISPHILPYCVSAHTGHVYYLQQPHFGFSPPSITLLSPFLPFGVLSFINLSISASFVAPL